MDFVPACFFYCYICWKVNNQSSSLLLCHLSGFLNTIVEGEVPSAKVMCCGRAEVIFLLFLWDAGLYVKTAMCPNNQQCGETCEAFKVRKPHRWLWFTLRVHEDNIMSSLTQRYEVNLKSAPNDVTFHSFPLLMFLVYFPNFIYCLSDFSTILILSCLPLQTQWHTNMLVVHCESVQNCWNC